MVTKGIIESVISEYQVKVNIPFLNTVQDSIICTLPKCTFYPEVGDIVFVTFENYDINKPVIIGCLFKESGNSSNVSIEVQSLNVDGLCKLSNMISIGDITYEQLQYLSGLKQNVQNSIENIESSIDSNSGNFDITKNLKVINSNPYLQLQVGNDIYYVQAYDDGTLKGIGIGATWNKSMVVDNNGDANISGGLIVKGGQNIASAPSTPGIYAGMDSDNDAHIELVATNNNNSFIDFTIPNTDYKLRVIKRANGDAQIINDTATLTLPKISGEIALGGYSTSEIIIGKWIDNKILYRKVIDYTGNLALNTEIEVGSIGSQVSSVVDIKQTATYTPTGENSSAYDMYYNPTTGTHSIIGCRVDLVTGKIYACSVNDSWTDTHLIIIVEYTKA